MLGFIKSPFKPSSNPITISSEPVLITSHTINESIEQSQYNANTSKATKNSYKNDFQDSGGLESQSLQELQHYAVYKAKETTNTANNCLMIAVDMKEDASKTLETLHHQGEQIYKTHEIVVNVDRDLSKRYLHEIVVNLERDLSKGEKLLGSLGGMFSRTWKPKKTREIAGPKITPEKPSKPATKEQREKLGTAPLTKQQQAEPEPTNCYQKIETEKAKQDDVLDNLSNILGDLKGMAFDMGSELNRQSKALDHLNDDIDEMNSRMKGADKRARNLVGK